MLTYYSWNIKTHLVIFPNLRGSKTLQTPLT